MMFTNYFPPLCVFFLKKISLKCISIDATGLYPALSERIRSNDGIMVYFLSKQIYWVQMKVGTDDAIDLLTK